VHSKERVGGAFDSPVASKQGQIRADFFFVVEAGFPRSRERVFSISRPQFYSGAVARRQLVG